MSINRELSQLASFIDVQEDNNFIGISTGGTYTVGIGTSSVNISPSGTITANEFNGPTGSSLIDHIDLQDEGSIVGSGFTTLNFVGAAVAITQGVSGVATITVDSTAVSGDDGAVQFSSSGSLTGISTLLFADSTNYRVGIGSSAPTATLDVNGTVNVSGVSTFQNKVYHKNSAYFADGTGLNFGDDNDLSLYHTGSSSNIKEDGTGNLNIWGNNISFIDSTGTRYYADFNDGDSVDLYYNGSKKFSTTGIGVSIVGTGNTATITGPENLVLDPAVVGDATGKVIILGDLQVDGTQTVINSTTLTVDDKSIVLASGAADSSAANGAGIEVDGASATLQYAHSGTKWVANKDLQAEAFIKNGGTSSQFLKADGSVDSSAYITSADGGDAATLDGLDSTSFLRSDANSIKSTGYLRLNDGIQLTFGTDADMEIFHNGVNGYVRNNVTGNLYLANTFNTGDVIIQSDDGSGGDATYFLADGSSGESILYHYGNQKLATKSNGIDVTGHTETDTLNVSGVSTFQDDVSFTSATTGLGVFYDRSADTLKLLENGSDNTKLILGDDSTYTSHMEMYHDGGNSGIGYINYHGSNKMMLSGNNISFFNKSRSEEMLKAVENNGVFLFYDNVQKFQTTASGIDVTGHTETDTLNVSGIATAQDFNSASDENLKTNIRTIEDPLAKVVQIRGVNFDWKETQRPALGVIAQEVERVLPELVTDNGTKTVNYNGLIGLLIEAVKEQQKQINTLSERLSKLE